MELYDKINNYIISSEIDAALLSADCVLCAYSGGADSGVLLDFLYHYLKKRNIKLAAAHFNHMIRGTEADCDESFCKEAACAYNIPFFSKKEDIPAIAENSGLGLEECARNERYLFLNSIAATLGKNVLIATAHNATDNLESVLFNMFRGTGLKGLRGISPYLDGKTIRPLLCCTSEEIREYANKNNIKYVVDSTNSDTDYTRNYIRKNIVPSARKINANVDSAVLRMSSIARSDNDFIEGEAEKLLGTCRTHIDRDTFNSAHSAVAVRALTILYKEVAGNAKNLSQIHFDDIFAFAKNKTGTLSMPQNIKFFSDTDRIYFAARDNTDIIDDIKSIEPNGEIVTFGNEFAVAVTTNQNIPEFDRNIYNLSIHEEASFDRIYGSLFIRSRREGDLYRTGGMHKRLKKLMCDKKMPRRMRDCLPLFCDNQGIVWVPTMPLRDNTKGDNLNMYVFIRKGSVFDE